MLNSFTIFPAFRWHNFMSSTADYDRRTVVHEFGHTFDLDENDFDHVDVWDTDGNYVYHPIFNVDILCVMAYTRSPIRRPGFCSDCLNEFRIFGQGY
jgi:hypothetical protein